MHRNPLKRSAQSISGGPAITECRVCLSSLLHAQLGFCCMSLPQHHPADSSMRRSNQRAGTPGHECRREQTSQGHMHEQSGSMGHLDASHSLHT